jgi:hypothetical protein
LRPSDVVLFAVVVLAMVRPWTPLRHSRAALTLVPAVALATAGAHLAIEPRWQLGPAYLAALVLAVGAIADWRTPSSSAGRVLATGGTALLVSLAGLLAWALPVLELPAPTGPYAVGTRVVTLEDPARDDPYAPGVQPRRIAVQVWYPTVDVDEPTGPWLPSPAAAVDAIAGTFEVPGMLLSHLADVDGHARVDARAVERGDFPLVVFSHGWSGTRLLHTSQLASIASHGYVVAGLDHTHAALVTVFSDGTTIGLDPRTLPSDPSSPGYADAARTLLATFADDLELTVDALDTVLPADLAAAIDHDRVALVGHSTGGGASYLACSRRRWCDATIGYDPWVEPLPDELVGAGLERPMLSIRSADWLDTPNDVRLRRLHAGSSGTGGRVAIHGTLHRDFSLAGLVSPLSPHLGYSGRTPARETLAIVDAWTVAFLDHHLKGLEPDPLEHPPANGRIHVAMR